MNLNQQNLKKIYDAKASLDCAQAFNIKNQMNIPKIICIHINMGLGDAVNDFKIIEKNKKCLELICGQKAVITTANKSIAAFKLRKGVSIGVKVTLRKGRMWDFLERFLNIALPRIKDFKGINERFDGCGNLTIGVKEQIIFPEIDYNNIDKIRGMNVTIITSSTDDKQAAFLLKKIGVPFK